MKFKTDQERFMAVKFNLGGRLYYQTVQLHPAMHFIVAQPEPYITSGQKITPGLAFWLPDHARLTYLLQIGKRSFHALQCFFKILLGCGVAQAHTVLVAKCSTGDKRNMSFFEHIHTEVISILYCDTSV